MLRSKVLVVDHVTDHWKDVNFHSSSGQLELQVLEDGLEAYMECEQNEFETLLIRENLPGVSGSELAETVLNNQPETQVVMFGCDGHAEGGPDFSSLRTQRLSYAPGDAEEAAQMLEQVVSSLSPAK